MNRPFVVAGPCSAESLSQLRYVARAFKALGNVDFFRAGVWKPRTQPNMFEGKGDQALLWLSAVQHEFQLPVATEVASPAHVEAVRKAGLKGVWIGARTTVNPFVVQEIASALAGSDIKVFVKNPVNPDVALWAGALERFIKMGIDNLVAVHRGFSVYGPGGYRNAPIWLVPLELKRRMPDIPLLCDPSHISGDSALVPSLAQKAMDLYFDGLMIEVHPNPEKALSDAQQQLTVSGFERLMHSLVLRAPDTSNQDLNSRLEGLRAQIDLVDDQIVEHLAQRMQVVNEIGSLKREGGITIYQRRRWEELIARIKQRGSTLGISPLFLEQLFSLVHQEAILRQQEVMQPEGEVSNERLRMVGEDFPAVSGMASCTVPQIRSMKDLSGLVESKNTILLIDEKVDELYGDRLPDLPKIKIEAQESNKSLETLQKILEQLVALQADRTVFLLGIGGGIVCDLTGFVASVYMRGVSFALIPTTLLSQADAAIGGKNGVNFEGLKNVIGCISQPKWILCDPGFLQTLPKDEIRSGLGEVIKHALIGEPALLDYLEQQAGALVALEPEALAHVLSVSHKLKCSVVQADEREEGLRRILNLGHTVGHAIEACAPAAGSRAYTHGEAVAVGLLYATALSIRYAGFGDALLPRLKALYLQLSLPTALPCPLEEVGRAIIMDKKRAGGVIRWILLKNIGKPYQQEIPVEDIMSALQWARNRLSV